MEEIIDDEAAWDSEPNPDMVHWQPTHHSVRSDLADEYRAPIRAAPAGALVFVAVGSAGVGAVAIGALAIGALAIGKLFVRDARFRRLEVDELVIGKVRWRR